MMQKATLLQRLYILYQSCMHNDGQLSLLVKNDPFSLLATNCSLQAMYAVSLQCDSVPSVQLSLSLTV